MERTDEGRTGRGPTPHTRSSSPVQNENSGPLSIQGCGILQMPRILLLPKFSYVRQGGGALKKSVGRVKSAFLVPHPIAAHRTRLIEKADCGHIPESIAKSSMRPIEVVWQRNHPSVTVRNTSPPINFGTNPIFGETNAYPAA